MATDAEILDAFAKNARYIVELECKVERLEYEYARLRAILENVSLALEAFGSGHVECDTQSPLSGA